MSSKIVYKSQPVRHKWKRFILTLSIFIFFMYLGFRFGSLNERFFYALIMSGIIIIPIILFFVIVHYRNNSVIEITETDLSHSDFLIKKSIPISEVLSYYFLKDNVKMPAVTIVTDNKPIRLKLSYIENSDELKTYLQNNFPVLKSTNEDLYDQWYKRKHWLGICLFWTIGNLIPCLSVLLAPPTKIIGGKVDKVSYNTMKLDAYEDASFKIENWRNIKAQRDLQKFISEGDKIELGISWKSKLALNYFYQPFPYKVALRSVNDKVLNDLQDGKKAYWKNELSSSLFLMLISLIFAIGVYLGCLKYKKLHLEFVENFKRNKSSA